MSDFTSLRDRVDSLAGSAPLPEFGELKRRAARRRRHRRVAFGATVAAALVVVPLALIAPGDDRAVPLEQPKPVIGEGPVWFDVQGLHRGDVVEQTPVDHMGALALVRSGAVYQDPATREVWFHPWGGDPHVVGHDVIAGPGGDPEGDIAAWFEGSELVLYDTAADREISRTSKPPALANCREMCAEHYPAGSNFLEVSNDRVAWTSGFREVAYEVDPRPFDLNPPVAELRDRTIIDVHGDIWVDYVDGEQGGWSGTEALQLLGPGLQEAYPDLEPRARLSPDGHYVLGVEARKDRHAAAIVDVRTGRVWHVPRNEYPFISWSYGDTALVGVKDQLLACDASRRTCESLPAGASYLTPTT